MRELKKGQLITTERLNTIQRQVFNPIATGGAASLAPSGLSQPRVDVSKTPFVRSSGAMRFQWFSLYQIYDNYVSAYKYNMVADTTGTELFNVALPLRLQRQMYDGVSFDTYYYYGGVQYDVAIEYDYVNPTERTATASTATEDQIITPAYAVAEKFFAIQMVTNVTVSSAVLQYMAMFPGRDWAMK